ncbi:MAG TPA: Uma2 family endonuclease [Longimicrobiaceae bacterium]|nr:Uma2 family endonuclease [Longimicrobiaceae bacterium]
MTETLQVPQVPVVTGITFEEFLSAYAGVRAEWVDGTVVVMSPGNTPQSRLMRFLGSILQIWAEEHGLGEVLIAPLSVRMGTSAREPDVFFFRTENLHRVHQTFAEGAPDLVIEIISRDTRGVDRGEKFYEYEQGGVPEYWLVDPERKKVEAYRLSTDGTYELTGLGDPETLRAEALPGLALPVEWLWRESLPRVSDVLKDWGLR